MKHVEAFRNYETTDDTQLTPFPTPLDCHYKGIMRRNVKL